MPGDGIGPEVTFSTVQVLNKIGERYDHTFAYHEQLIGGCAIDAYGTALTDETIQICQQSDAVLLGAVGGPKWDDPNAAVRLSKDFSNCANHWMCLPISGQSQSFHNSWKPLP